MNERRSNKKGRRRRNTRDSANINKNNENANLEIEEAVELNVLVNSNNLKV
jgi:hypothetical protein